MQLAISRGVPSRLSGLSDSYSCLTAAGSPACSTKPTAIGVSITPGQTQLARMFLGAVSSAIARVSWSTAPLEAQYAASCSHAMSALIEPTVTIAPPSGMCRSAARHA